METERVIKFRKDTMAAGYKAKTIKAILSRKINKWIDSITDGDLQTLLKHQVIVTGGAIVSMLQGEEVGWPISKQVRFFKK